MRMLIEKHQFVYHASVPWPGSNQQVDWVMGIEAIEHWLEGNIGDHWIKWAWNDSQSHCHIGVAFRWDQDRSLFLLRWAG